MGRWEAKKGGAAGTSGGRAVLTQGEESKGLKVKSRRSAQHSRVFDFRTFDFQTRGGHLQRGTGGPPVFFS